MITVCPKCSLKLTVTSADLNIAQGYVRCGRCSNVFNALNSLAEESQQGAAQPQARQAPPQQAAGQQAPAANSPVQQAAPPQTAAPAQRTSPPPAPNTPAQQAAPPQTASPAQRTPAPNSPAQQAVPPQTAAPTQRTPPPAAPNSPSQQAAAVQTNAPAWKATPSPVSASPAQQQPLPQTAAPAQKVATPPQTPAPQQKQAAPPPPASVQKVTPFTPASKAPSPVQKAAPPPPPPLDDEFGEDISLEFDATSTNVTGVFIPPGDKRDDADSIPGMSMDEVTVTNVRPIQQPQPNPPARRAPPPPQRTTPPPPPQRNAGAAAPAARNSAPAPARQAPGTSPSRPERNGGAGVASERNRPASPALARTGRNGAPATPAQRPQRSPPPPPPRPSSERSLSNDDSDFDLIGSDDRELSPATMRADRGNSQGVGRAERTGRGSSDRFSPIPSGVLGQVLGRLQNVPPAVAWSAGSGLLFVVLLLQIIHHYRGDLAAQPQFFGPMTAVYRAIGVSLVPRWDMDAYEVRQLGAVAGSDTPGQLTVRASVKNGAQNSQPLPLLRVVVQDRFGNRVAARDVPPSVYASRRAAQEGYIPAGQRVDAEIRFVDPGQIAVGFEIDACLPASGGGILCAGDGDVR